MSSEKDEKLLAPFVPSRLLYFIQHIPTPTFYGNSHVHQNGILFNGRQPVAISENDFTLTLFGTFRHNFPFIIACNGGIKRLQLLFYYRYFRN